jgi:ABC-type multidrug transport system ATPase subunit
MSEGRVRTAMTTSAIEIQDVSKTYGDVAAVLGLSLSVPLQSVYGFLGPNGAGKTTTIRMVLGLQRPDRGSLSLFGRSLYDGRLDLLRRTGSLVETPSLYPHLSGRENLEVHRRLLRLPVSSIHDALETVDLLAVADRLVRTYSHGMRQRLGIALALLGNPDLLVLDEPTNGLDPNGIHEVRALIRSLPQTRGITVFLSSHLLSEVEQVATHFAILSHGEVQFQGTKKDLRKRNQPTLVIEVDQPDKACVLLANAGYQVRRQDQRVVVDAVGDSDAAQINTTLVHAKLLVSYLAVESATLEDVYLELTHP